MTLLHCLLIIAFSLSWECLGDIEGKEVPKFVEDHYKHLQMFSEFLMKYHKHYSTEEEYYARFQIFRDNVKTAEIQNAEDLGTATYGVTKFSDLSQEEFKRNYLGFELPENFTFPTTFAETPDVELPESFDWRTKKAVTRVKDQGVCLSCWAFSTIGNVEGQYAIKYNKLVEFSEQELVSCLTMYCAGYCVDAAMLWIQKHGGLETEHDYPYTSGNGGNGGKCAFKKSLAKVQIKDVKYISQDETEMAKWLVKNGPIAVAINSKYVQGYEGGIVNPKKADCNNNLDHAVLIVGYGVKKSKKQGDTPYWIVKNSWGADWGPNEGYFLMYRGGGTCGINVLPVTAVIE